MENDAILKGYNPLELMLKWNRYCDAHNREADCILLNEERTYTEAFANEEEAMKEILNSSEPDFRRDSGFLVPIWSIEGKYIGMRQVTESRIGQYINLSLIDL